jgi:hypothetical protein
MVSIQIMVFCVLTHHVAPLFDGLVLGFCAVVDVCYNASEEHAASIFRLTNKIINSCHENLTRQQLVYNVTSRRIYITIVAMENHQVLQILSVTVFSP